MRAYEERFGTSLLLHPHEVVDSELARDDSEARTKARREAKSYHRGSDYGLSLGVGRVSEPQSRTLRDYQGLTEEFSTRKSPRDTLTVV